MKSDFEEYLATLDITRKKLKRVEEIYAFYEGFCREEITGVFVTEYIDKDARRIFESLWFFSANYIMESKDFLSTDNFDMANIFGKIRQCRILKKDYDFKKAAADSRLYCYIFSPEGWKAEFKASKENCDHLKMIIETYFLPNLV